MQRNQASERVAAAVRIECERQGVPQSRLVLALGLSPSAVSRRLRGEVPLDAAELAELGDLLGVPVGAFFPPVSGSPR